MKGEGVLLRNISLGIVLFGLWLLLSGHYETLTISLGVASCVLVVWISHRMDVADHEGHPIHLGWRAMTYFPWLAWEIVKANIDVARIIVNPKLPIYPVMIRITAGQKSELGNVIYANSITLTPGTVTVAVEGDQMEIHAITNEAALEVESGRMDMRATRMEGER